MRVLVTGASGMLGTDLCERLAVEHEVIATGVQGEPVRFDITDFDSPSQVFSKYKPHCVVHCAAWTDVDACETNQSASKKINVGGTLGVLQPCIANNLPLIAISTDFVFDGNHETPYTELDIPNPISEYGRQKLKMEEMIRASHQKHYILRTAWLYGKNGKNFPQAILNAAKAEKPLRVITDQVGSPTFTKDLAEIIAYFVKKKPKFGTYHAVNSGEASRWELAKAVLEIAGRERNIEQITADDWKTPAARPAYSTLSTQKIEALGIRIRPWRDALGQFIHEIL